MRVLLVSQFYHPEAVAAAHRTESFARYLKAQGHDVAVIAEKPNHPDGVIWEDYRGGLFARRDVDGVPVVYTWVAVSPEKRFLTRILFYLSFMSMAVLAAFRLRGRFDVVVATSPPLFVGISGWLISRIKRAKYVFDVRDQWPDLAVAMQELTRPAVIRWARRMERFIYRKAHGLTATTRGFCAHIRGIVGPDKPLALVPNGTVVGMFEHDRDRQEIRERLDVAGRFTAVYAGNVGICQGLGHLLDAAEILRDDPDVLLLVVGGGPVRAELTAEAERRELGNIRFVPPVDRPTAAAYQAAADVLLVPLADHEIYRSFIPSKLFDAMAAARPILLAVDGEAREILEAAGAGRYYRPENGAALAEGIRWMRERSGELEAMGLRGRNYVAAQYGRERQAQRMATFLTELVEGRPAPIAPQTAEPVGS